MSLLLPTLTALPRQRLLGAMASTAAVALLAACGGNGTDSDGAPVSNENAQGYAADAATICGAEPGCGPSRERCVPGKGQAAFVARWARAPVRRTYSLSSAWHSSAMNPVVSCNLRPLPR